MFSKTDEVESPLLPTEPGVAGLGPVPKQQHRRRSRREHVLFVLLCLLVGYILLGALGLNPLDGRRGPHLSAGLANMPFKLVHTNPVVPGLEAPHVQLELGPYSVLYRGKGRKVGVFRTPRDDEGKMRKITGMQDVPPVSSHTCEKAVSNGTKVLIGVFTTAERAERRKLVREAEGFAKYCTPEYGVECKFVIGQSYDAETHSKLVWEMNEYHDILLLDGEENMNEGKTYDFYRHIANRAEPMPQFVLKQDDDTFLHIPRLLAELDKLDCNVPTYFGGCWHESCGQHLGYPAYFGGMAYGVSSPLLRWIGDPSASFNRSLLAVPEDTLTGRFIHSMPEDERRNVLYYSMDEVMGNYRQPFVPWRPETVIAVHGMKDDQLYASIAKTVTQM